MRDPSGRAFQGAVESAEEPSLLSNTERMASAEATIGNTQHRQSGAFVTQSAESTSAGTLPPIQFSSRTVGAGGFAKTPISGEEIGKLCRPAGSWTSEKK